MLIINQTFEFQRSNSQAKMQKTNQNQPSFMKTTPEFDEFINLNKVAECKALRKIKEHPLMVTFIKELKSFAILNPANNTQSRLILLDETVKAPIKSALKGTKKDLKIWDLLQNPQGKVEKEFLNSSEHIRLKEKEQQSSTEFDRWIHNERSMDNTETEKIFGESDRAIRDLTYYEAIHGIRREEHLEDFFI